MSQPPPAYPDEKGAPPPAGYPAQPYPQAPPPAQYGQPAPAQPYPGQQGPYPGQPATSHQTVVVTQQPMVGATLGDIPATMTCPHCRAHISTGVRYESGTLTWLACGGICLLGCVLGGITWLGCCFIPFCIDGCKDTIHNCPNCGQIVGRKNRM